jgi:hypothetical protein
MIFAMRTLALSATALLLGACADVRAFVEEGRQPSTIARGAAPARDVAGAPAPPRLIDGAAPSQPAQVAAVQPRAAAGPLVGLGQAAVVSALGPANFTRRDGPAEIWRYDAQPCFLDVFFYREADGQRVNYVAARSQIANRTVTAEACYSAIVAERRNGSRTG